MKGDIMTISYININGIPAKLFRADNAHGTVLAIHGFGGSKESSAITGLAERVCDKGVNVLTFDLPAHGERDGGAEQLDPMRCIEEIIAVEKYIKAELTNDIYAFATSFGGMCLLHRIERLPHTFKRIVLRVPAVNMAYSLFAISKGSDPTLTVEKAREHGFRIVLGREYLVPYNFYEGLSQMHCLRHSEAWDSSDIFVVRAENDELVQPSDTMEFLRHNPSVRSLCINGSGHRMSDPQHLAEALDAAAYHLFE